MKSRKELKRLERKLERDMARKQPPPYPDIPLGGGAERPEEPRYE